MSRFARLLLQDKRRPPPIRRSWPGILAFAFGVLTSQSSPGVPIVYDNGAPDLVTALASDFHFPAQAAEDFSLTSETTISGVQWWGTYGGSFPGPPSPDTFTIRLYLPDIDGSPMQLPEREWQVGQPYRIDTGLDLQQNFDLFEYRATLGEITLSEGDYFLSIVNNTIGTRDDWFWATSDANGNAFHRSFDSSAWRNDIPSRQLELAFRVLGVPEPASVVVLATGLIAAVFSPRRRR